MWITYVSIKGTIHTIDLIDWCYIHLFFEHLISVYYDNNLPQVQQKQFFSYYVSISFVPCVRHR